MCTPTVSDIPVDILTIISHLEQSGYQAYLVGGAVRDLCRDLRPQDWDICTSARPEEVGSLFSKTYSTGIRYGTVSIPTPTCGSVQVTTFRREGPYSDGRRPDYVEFSTDLSTDLSRRDFTCNALAYHPHDGLIDLYGGLSDLNEGILRCVGDPYSRLHEDNLRILRAFRFQVTLGLRLDRSLAKAILDLAPRVATLPPERIGGEMQRLLSHPQAYKGIRRMRAAGVLKEILPELTACYGLEQNKYHAYSVYGHTIVTMKHCADEPDIRTALLLHDLGKAVVAEETVNGVRRFWGHQDASARLAEAILKRWSWPSQARERIVSLVKEHMFYWPQSPSDKALRRFIGKIGQDLVLPLMEVRKADIVGLGPEGKQRLWPWNVLRDRITAMLAEETVFSVHNLEISGSDLITELGLSEGPTIGALLTALFEAVISDEIPNERNQLLTQAKKLLLSGSLH